MEVLRSLEKFKSYKVRFLDDYEKSSRSVFAIYTLHVAVEKLVWHMEDHLFFSLIFFQIQL